MSSFDYEGRRFVSKSNTAGGEVDSRTVFHYRQQGEIVWATYEGGEILFGTLIARRAVGRFVAGPLPRLIQAQAAVGQKLRP